MKRATIITTACILALLFGSVATFRHVDRNSAQPIRELSKMMSVKITAASALSDYFAKQGRYPRSLDELSLQMLKWGDEGSSPRDMDGWRYISDGSSFTMTWTNARGVELYLGGTTGQLYYSCDERR